MSVGAVVLAAGASTRMGRPKALIEWRGRPFLLHCISGGLEAGCVQSVVVDGATDLASAVPSNALLVHNPDWEVGPLSSLQCGLRASLRREELRGVLVQTVDRPHVQVETLRALLGAFANEPTKIWQPRCGERAGHPILYPRDVAEALLTLPMASDPRELLRSAAMASRRASVVVGDPAVNDNLDTPEALRQLGE